MDVIMCQRHVILSGLRQNAIYPIDIQIKSSAGKRHCQFFTTIDIQHLSHWLTYAELRVELALYNVTIFIVKAELIFFNGMLLTPWGRVTDIYVNKLTIIGSDNGLLTGPRQAIIWTDARILVIGHLGTNSSGIFIEICTFSFKNMRLKMPSGQLRPFCLSLNVLKVSSAGSKPSWPRQWELSVTIYGLLTYHNHLRSRPSLVSPWWIERLLSQIWKKYMVAFLRELR